MRTPKFGITEDENGESTKCYVHGFLMSQKSEKGGIIVCEMIGTGKIHFKNEGDVRFETDDEAHVRHSAAAAARAKALYANKPIVTDEKVNFVPEF